MDMEDHNQYGNSSMADICMQLMNCTRPIIPPSVDMFPEARDISRGGQQQYEMMMVGGQVGEIIPVSEDLAAVNTANITVTGFEAEAGFFNGGGDVGTARWPRQETLTLLEVRSRLHSKFKEANQKGPLWDEISRIMYEEHGYQRSGKKCREKFENLYKYYKKTKYGKAGRQDGKHYRFFRQLEALYGESSTSNTPAASLQEKQFVFPTTNHEALCSQLYRDSLSLSNSFGNESSSSDESSGNKRGPSKWKAKIKGFIDSQMKKLIDKQEAWFDKMIKTIEQKEQERLRREEEWKKQEAARLELEHKYWAKERAWIEARDAALMDALHKFTGRELNAITPNSGRSHVNQSCENQHDNSISNTSSEQRWSDAEITRLIELRTSMESRIQRSQGGSEWLIWEEISTRMACLGYDKTAVMCKEKWDSICNDYMRRSRNESSNKKRKENSMYDHNSMYSQGGVYTDIGSQGHENIVSRQQVQSNDGNYPLNCNVGNAMPDTCLRFLMGDGENLWENYGFKLNKGGH